MNQRWISLRKWNININYDTEDTYVDWKSENSNYIQLTGTDGLYTDRVYKNGTKVVSFTISNSITWLNELGVTTAPSSKQSGGFGGKGGQRPPRTQGQNSSGAQGQAPAAQ